MSRVYRIEVLLRKEMKTEAKGWSAFEPYPTSIWACKNIFGLSPMQYLQEIKYYSCFQNDRPALQKYTHRRSLNFWNPCEIPKQLLEDICSDNGSMDRHNNKEFMTVNIEIGKNIRDAANKELHSVISIVESLGPLDATAAPHKFCIQVLYLLLKRRM